VRLLLDTHALLWFLGGDRRLSRRAQDAIADPENVAYVSAVSAWEIATKHRLGKLPHAGPLATAFHATVTEGGFAVLSITARHGQAAGALPGPHRDPFDRMLIAQSLARRLRLVSSETVFDQYGVRRVW
jgi:PIN domain nuclease of toxin-antitoxin system